MRAAGTADAGMVQVRTVLLLLLLLLLALLLVLLLLPLLPLLPLLLVLTPLALHRCTTRAGQPSGMSGSQLTPYVLPAVNSLSDSLLLILK